MRKARYAPLHGDSFHESFLIEVVQLEWPNVYVFIVWSPNDNVFYRITTENVLEYHFMRIGTGKLNGVENGIPLDDIYTTKERDFDYWSERIAAFHEQGSDNGEEPVCIEFSSHLFANRQRKILTRDRDVGLLVVCRQVSVTKDHSYEGPRPAPYVIPSRD